MLLKSIKSKRVDGIEFPGFPEESVQAQFVGSSNEAALREGFEFYKAVKEYASALGMPLNNGSSKLLDFGCGWGRYLRFFYNDIDEQNLYGVDIGPTILDTCRKSVIEALIREVGEVPANLRKTLTWDRGSEMAQYKVFTVATDVQVHFCDPRSPWQCGSNENTNRLLRKYSPAGTDLTNFDQNDLDQIAQQLNERPRKTLGFDTHAAKLTQYVALTG
jgi:hypothetical protein